MVLISLSSPHVRKCLSPLTICIALTSASCFAHSIFFTVASTPYDRQMARVGAVLGARVAATPGRISFLGVNEWMTRLYAIPYRYSRKWRTPGELKSAQAGDCKGKAVALYQTMRANGARNVRLVIGKHRVEDLKTHAWVEWNTQNGNYLLDPTFNCTAARADQLDETTYVPFYAYDGAYKYRANNYVVASSYTTALGRNQLAAVSHGPK